MDEASIVEFGRSFKVWAGMLLIANLGTIGSLLFVGFKSVWYLSRLDARVDKSQDTANRAHKRLDKIEDKI